MRLLPFVAALLFAAPASASLNKTLDISGHAVRLNTAGFGGEAYDANGVSMRMGDTIGPMRIGIGFNGYAPEISCACAPGTRAGVFGLEAFIGYAPNGYWEMRPFIELRAHGDRLQLGGEKKITSGIGPRVGVLIPLSEYFFFDIGIGRDLVGPETLRATVGLGLPIPLSHL